jgi:hypothetical protein
MTRAYAVIVLILALSAPASAASVADDETEAIPTSGPGAEFLTVAAGARASAMGEAHTAAVDDATAVFWNPAALRRIEKRSVTAMHADYPGSARLDYAAIGARGPGQWAFGADFRYFASGHIDATNANGLATGSVYSPHDLAASGAAAYEIPSGTLKGFSLGAAVKFVQSRIIDTASTVAADFGLLSAPLWNDRLRLGAALTNLGRGLKFGQERDPLPQRARGGLALKLDKRWLAALDVVVPKGDDTYAAAGVEYAVVPRGDDWSLAARAGFNGQQSPGWMARDGASAGFGLAYRSFSLDYALMPFNTQGSAQRFSLTFNF